MKTLVCVLSATLLSLSAAGAQSSAAKAQPKSASVHTTGAAGAGAKPRGNPSYKPGGNSVITEFAGLPWGSSEARAKEKLGAPDSTWIRSSGGTTVYAYKNSEVLGHTLDMYLEFDQEGLVHGMYTTSTIPRMCGEIAFDFIEGIQAARPGIVEFASNVDGPSGMESYPPSRQCSLISQSSPSDSVGSFSISRGWKDPEGHASIVLLMTYARTYSKLFVMYDSGSKGVRKVKDPL